MQVGAGWHSHLDVIEALLAGSPTTRDAWTARYEELRPVYDEQAARLAEKTTRGGRCTRPPRRRRID